MESQDLEGQEGSHELKISLNYASPFPKMEVGGGRERERETVWERTCELYIVYMVALACYPSIQESEAGRRIAWSVRPTWIP